MLKFTTIFLLVYASICFFLYIKQRDLLFFPTPENHHVNARALWLQNGKERLKIWKFNEGEKAIIYFGGNAESVEYNIPDFKQAFNGYTVYLVNYRGYGGSTGTPSEKALFDDALFVYDEIKKQHPTISVVGRSLGSGVACFLASERGVDKLVLMTPYDSIKNLAQSHYPMFPVRWLLKDSFDSASRASLLTGPVLVLIAQHDNVIPLKHSQKLVRALTSALVESHVIDNTSHNNITDSADTLEFLKRFLTKAR